MGVDASLIDSASILIIRDGVDGLEVLMVRRHKDIEFAGGAYVFPGGKVDQRDLGLSKNIPSFPAGYSELTHTAFREVFEESGLIIGKHNNAAQFREALLAEEMPFSDLIKNANITFDMEAILPFARWVTPHNYPKRYDTRFYLAKAPDDQTATPDGHEAVELKWVKPFDFIEEFRDLMMFPTIMNLNLLGAASSVMQAFEQAKSRKIVTVEPKIIDGKRIIEPDAGYGEIDQDKIHSGFKK